MVFFFLGDPVNVVLGLHSPIIVSLFLITSPFSTAIKESSYLWTENLLSLCPTVRVPIGLDSVLMNFTAKRKTFAKFSFSSPRTLFPHSHRQVFPRPCHPQRGRSEVGNSSMPRNILNILKGTCGLVSQADLEEGS